jgi:hypothetical protein
MGGVVPVMFAAWLVWLPVASLTVTVYPKSPVLEYVSFTVASLPLPVIVDVNWDVGKPLMLTNVHEAEPGLRWKLIFPAAVIVTVSGSKANVLGAVNETFTVWSGMVFSW